MSAQAITTQRIQRGTRRKRNEARVNGFYTKQRNRHIWFPELAKGHPCVSGNNISHTSNSIVTSIGFYRVVL